MAELPILDADAARRKLVKNAATIEELVGI